VFKDAFTNYVIVLWNARLSETLNVGDEWGRIYLEALSVL
jgi:hypothetical protein